MIAFLIPHTLTGLLAMICAKLPFGIGEVLPLVHSGEWTKNGEATVEGPNVRVWGVRQACVGLSFLFGLVFGTKESYMVALGVFVSRCYLDVIVEIVEQKRWWLAGAFFATGSLGLAALIVAALA
eukprot:CAMPEP_0185252018 /NCGR_PEP_ID=MMETSP1359-20130426/1263_1 /TAXON_ID=552665 /ORGANISM="Bigelowiella longifila, Strain CCMP242" /LENGTH=124 /DNA_ID=CAMNT_0027834095 /DNA_START=534 /DNA_END=908 /DNA_ORIENTATION=-